MIGTNLPHTPHAAPHATPMEVLRSTVLNSFVITNQSQATQLVTQAATWASSVSSELLFFRVTLSAAIVTEQWLLG